jgi:predicted adenine nucleotide alpha hydrolase (AANH) superfamily ATPase
MRSLNFRVVSADVSIRGRRTLNLIEREVPTTSKFLTRVMCQETEQRGLALCASCSDTRLHF